ncbi:hypothetical protein B0I35DRAFT_260227 [Stachybotrys elegans]|uniref:Uncharacterized protein n=1 Tax=Stachybotrys elegans TaxID=80388 RepID=A0A8K0SUK2_9HYPO|nr:hypothetical protein B0I35DRAFT_260227 [Stachybotrys elegans]
MARPLTPSEETFSSQEQYHGLSFLNVDWNDSISSGKPFTLKWNRSVSEGSAALELYQVVYPEEGLVVYEPVSNLTASSSCTWTPTDLPDGLYTLWLTTKGDKSHDAKWAISPAWRPSIDPKKHGWHWAAPVGIPIVVVVSLYAVGLVVCLLRRRGRKSRQQTAETMALDPDSNGRHGSFSSVVTVQTLDDDDRKDKAVWEFSHEPSASTASPSPGATPQGDCACAKLREPEMARLDSRDSTRRSSIA